MFSLYCLIQCNLIFHQSGILDLIMHHSWTLDLNLHHYGPNSTTPLTMDLIYPELLMTGHVHLFVQIKVFHIIKTSIFRFASILCTQLCDWTGVLLGKTFSQQWDY